MTTSLKLLSLPDRVRGSCRRVAGRSRFVAIRQDRVVDYALSLPLDPVTLPEHDPGAHFLGRGADTVAFFVTLDAVNFGSGYFPHLRKRVGMSGYFTVASS